MSSKDKDKDQRSQRAGSVVAEDADLTTWLHELWGRNEIPDRLEVHQMFGRNKLEAGQMIYHRDFRPNDKLDVERINKMANEIVAAAINDCNGVERKQHYQVSVIDLNRKATPLVRRLGPFHPTKTSLLSKVGARSELDEDDEEELPRNGKTLAERYVDVNFGQIKWDKQRYDTVMGQMLTLQSNIIDRQQETIEKTTASLMDLFRQAQEAEDRRLDRDIRRQKEELKAQILRDIFRTARNVIPGLVNKRPTVAQGKPGQPGLGGQPRESKAVGAGAEPDDYGPSAERALVDNFLADCEETGISVKLFGDWQETDEGAMAPVPGKPGIFMPPQFAILIGVRDGRLPPEALDVLLPDSGNRNAVTQSQMMQAMPIMSEGTAIALRELITLRQEARSAAEPEEMEME